MLTISQETLDKVEAQAKTTLQAIDRNLEFIDALQAMPKGAALAVPYVLRWQRYIYGTGDKPV